MQELWELVRLIPRGRVATYGDLGRALRNPVSGLIVGRWMASCPEGVPWWRVVGRNGDLLLARRGALFAADQEQRLRREGVRFVEDRVDMDRHRMEV